MPIAVAQHGRSDCEVTAMGRRLGFVGLFALCSVLGLQASAEAQPAGQQPPAGQPATGQPAGGEGEMTFTTEEATTPPAEGQAGAEAQAGGEGDVLSQLAAPAQTQQQAPQEQAVIRHVPEEILAVQQVYAKRAHRVAIAPSFGTSLNDPFVNHPALAIAGDYYITEVLAVGLNLLWFEFGSIGNLRSDTDFHVSRSYGLVVPINEYQIGGGLNFSYVPLYGKFALFKEVIVHWDSYVIGGVGVMRTRPIPVVDPSFRKFDYGNRISILNPGIGFRVYTSRFAALFIELRDYIFIERTEARQVQVGAQRFDEQYWLEEGGTLTNNVMFHFGISIFLPFTFEYKLPK
jgi:outer membrane beta-barrel protein